MWEVFKGFFQCWSPFRKTSLLLCFRRNVFFTFHLHPWQQSLEFLSGNSSPFSSDRLETKPFIHQIIICPLWLYFLIPLFSLFLFSAWLLFHMREELGSTGGPVPLCVPWHSVTHLSSYLLGGDPGSLPPWPPALHHGNETGEHHARC